MRQRYMSVDHGQAAEAVRENFEKAIATAQSQYGRFIERLEWSPDRTEVHASGTGFDVRLSYDDRSVYARGTVPMPAKRLEGPIKAFIARALK